MNKLALVSMAAIAASLPSLATAQERTVAPPVAWEEVPQVGLSAPAAPAAGVTWQDRARSSAPQLVPTQAAAVQAAPAAAAIVRQAARAGGGHRMGRMGGHRMGKAGGHRMGGFGGHRMSKGSGHRMGRAGGHHVGKGGGHRMGRVGGHHIGKGGHRMGRFGGHHKGKRFDHIRRIHRGGRVHGFFWGPQFHVRNWGLYGFPEPIHDRRWVRYYDDAYLIDGDGRVHDSRYGLDWDEYGERWDYDERGIPVYGDDDDAYEGEEDYAWDGEAEGEYSEEWDEGRDRDAHHGGGYRKHGGGHAYQGGSCTVTYSFDGSHPAPPPPPPPPGCGHGGGYGHGYGPGVVVTETIVTTHPVVTEDVVRVRKHKRHHGKYRPRHAPPPPPPEPGERG